MRVLFQDAKLAKLESEAGFAAGFAQEAMRGYRRVMQFIRAANDERDFYAMRSLNFEKLLGKRFGQYSFRINDQWRLIACIQKSEPKNTIVILEITDYH